jgi:hypothetical protein
MTLSRKPIAGRATFKDNINISNSLFMEFKGNLYSSDLVFFIKVYILQMRFEVSKKLRATWLAALLVIIRRPVVVVLLQEQHN